jgi:mRNA interferase MazF
MPFEFGDVVLVSFPFTSQTASKQRPAVIVSSHTYSATRPDVVVMAITSQLRSVTGFGETLIHGWHAAKLLKPSVIKPVFATLEQSLIIKQLGTLHETDQVALKRAISQLIG